MPQAINGHRLPILVGSALLVGLVTVSTAQAGETLTGEEVVIDEDKVFDDDLYVAANNVAVKGTIQGGLVAVGNSITVDGTVEGDLIAAGQSVEVGGQVDDVRIAGQALLLSEGAVVRDDLIAAGYSLENEPESSVGGDLWYACYQALLAGIVGEDLAATLNALELGGETSAGTQT